jgi:ankyrin repeat protein
MSKPRIDALFEACKAGSLRANTLSPQDIAEIRDIEDNSRVDVAIMSKHTRLLNDLIVRAGSALIHNTLNIALRSAVTTRDVKLVQDVYRLMDAIYHDKYDEDEYYICIPDLGVRALEEACKQGFEDMVPVLLDLNKSLFLGEALAEAWVHGHLGVVDMLIDAGNGEHWNPDFTIKVIMRSHELLGNSIDEGTRTKLINYLVDRGAGILQVEEDEAENEGVDTDDDVWWYYYRIGYYGTGPLARYFIAGREEHEERCFGGAMAGAINGNNAEAFRCFLDEAQSRGFTVRPEFDLALRDGCSDIVERLFDDYEIDLSRSGGDFVLNRDQRFVYAARCGSIKLLSAILRCPGQDVNCVVKFNCGSISDACTALSRTTDPAVIRFLLDSKADINPEGCDTVLRGACEELRPDAVKALLAAGAEVNRVGSYEGAKSALHYAVYAECTNDRVSDQIEVINMLLAAGADTHNCGGDKSVLDLGKLSEYSSIHLDTAFAAVLARDPGLVHCRDASGATPLLQVLRKYKEPAPVKVLLDAKADVNAVDDDGNTALSLFLTVNDDTDYDGMAIRRIIRLLADAGADLTQCREGVETPLMKLLPPREGFHRSRIWNKRLESGRCVGDTVLRDILDAILYPPAAMDD